MHKHPMGKWSDGGPRRRDLRRVVRDRLCIKPGCLCDGICCFESAAFRLDKKGRVTRHRIL